MTQKTHRGYRHCYTDAADGRAGRAGFQSVAWSPELESLLDILERLVGGYRCTPADAETRRPSRQVILLPWDEQDFYALTTFTPSGESPDGRRGNYWAETIVVPAKWLEQGGWDAATAFDALDWQGPAADGGEWPRRIDEPIGLPPFESEPFARLGSLCEAVPENLLHPLVLGVAAQVRNRQQLVIVEAPERDVADVQSLVPTLPLVLPPAARAFPAGTRVRTFQLRTLGIPPVALGLDLVGVSAPARESARLDGDALVIDLGGRLGSSADDFPRDTKAYDYAHWLAETLRARDWERLDACWRRAAGMSGPQFLNRFAELKDGPAPAPETAEAVEPPVDARVKGADAAPRRRRTAATPPPEPESPPRTEPAAAAEPPPAEPPPAPLPEDRAAEWERLDVLDRRLALDRQRHQERLVASAQAVQDEMALTAQGYSRALDEQSKSLGRTLARGRETLLEALRDQAGELHRALEERFETERGALVKQLREQVQRAYDEARSDASRTAGKEGRPGGGTKGGWFGWAFASGARRLGSAAILGVLCGALGVGAVWWSRTPGPAPPAGSDTTATSDTTNGPADDPATRVRGELARPEVAAMLLLRAAAASGDTAGGEPPREVRERAAILFLDLVLDERPPRDAGLRNRLLQAALDVGVDGAAGSDTLRAMRETLGEQSCCLALGGEAQRHCFLNAYLGLEENPCRGGDLFAKDTSWTYTEARQLLVLLRRAAVAAKGATTAAFQQQVADLDLQRKPERVEAIAALEHIDAQEVEHLLELAAYLADADADDDPDEIAEWLAALAQAADGDGPDGEGDDTTAGGDGGPAADDAADGDA